jgi:hypothetical protein
MRPALPRFESALLKSSANNPYVLMSPIPVKGKRPHSRAMIDEASADRFDATVTAIKRSTSEAPMYSGNAHNATAEWSVLCDPSTDVRRAPIDDGAPERIARRDLMTRIFDLHRQRETSLGELRSQGALEHRRSSCRSYIIFRPSYSRLAPHSREHRRCRWLRPADHRKLLGHAKATTTQR